MSGYDMRRNCAIIVKRRDQAFEKNKKMEAETDSVSGWTSAQYYLYHMYRMRRKNPGRRTG